jgi:hypothetical protein
MHKFISFLDVNQSHQHKVEQTLGYSEVFILLLKGATAHQQALQ